VGDFRIEIRDASGTLVYTSDVVTATGEGENIVTIPINQQAGEEFILGDLYDLKFVNEAGSYVYAEYTSAEAANDGQGLNYYDNSNSVVNEYYTNGYDNSYDLKLKLTFENGQEVVLETDGVDEVYSGTLVVTEDLDTTDTHTFQQIGEAGVSTNSEAVVTDLSVVVNADGTYTVDGNFDALADGERATVSFQYTATDDSGTENSVSEPKTVTLTVTGTNDQPLVDDVDVNSNAGTNVVGLDALDNNMMGAYYIQDVAETFVATQDTLNQVELELYYPDYYTGTFKVQITDGQGYTYVSEVVSSADVTDVNSNNSNGYTTGVLSVNLDASLNIDTTYTMSFIPVSGSAAISTVEASNSSDGLGLLASGSYLYDHRDVSLRLTYDHGDEVVFEGDGLEEIYTGALTLSEDLDNISSHTFQQVGNAQSTVASDAVITDVSVVVNADGTYSVNGNFDALAQGETASVSFQYTATDDSGAENAVSEPKTVTLIVTGTNDAPTLETAIVFERPEDIGLVMTEEEILANFSDIDNGDVLSLDSIVSDSGTITSDGNGTWNFMPDEDFSGDVSFTITVSDENGGTVSSNAIVHISAVADLAENEFTASTLTSSTAGELGDGTDGSLYVAHDDYYYYYSYYSGGKYGGGWYSYYYYDSDFQTVSQEFVAQNDSLDSISVNVTSLESYTTMNVRILDSNNTQVGYKTIPVSSTGVLEIDFAPDINLTSGETYTVQFDIPYQGRNVDDGLTIATIDLDIGTTTIHSYGYGRYSSDYYDYTSITGNDVGIVFEYGATSEGNSTLTFSGSIVQGDNDNSETLGNITIAGLIGASVNNGAIEVNASGEITISPSQLDGLNIQWNEVVPDGTTLTMSVTSSEGDSTATSTFDIVIEGDSATITNTTVSSEGAQVGTDGNDLLTFEANTDFDGRDGYDTLIFDSQTGDIDMLSILDTASNTEITNIEEFDLSEGDHILSNITVEQVLEMTDENADHTLTITGDSGDRIELDLGESIASGDSVPDDSAWHQVDDTNEYVGVSVSGEAVKILMDGIDDIADTTV